ncbi:MAG: high-potential iron-sulfur protein [Rubricoccaceae bacterium]
MTFSDTSLHAPASRRAFVRRLAGLGALVVGGPALLTACGGGDDAITAASCPGYDALTPQDRQMREALNYVDASPNPAQLCTNCQFYVPEEGGSRCGGCTLFAGPVAPGGWCSSWAARAT